MHKIGHSEKVGDLKTCVYQRGKLIKQITQVILGKRLAFRVVEQDRIETDGATLLDGSFDLQSIDGGRWTAPTSRWIARLWLWWVFSHVVRSVQNDMLRFAVGMRLLRWP